MTLAIAHYLWLALTLVPITVPDVDGRPVRPLAVGGAPAVVLVFVATDCPIANAYAPEVQRIMAGHQRDGVRFFLVYADPTTTPAAAKAHAAAYGYAGCRLLLDPHGALAARVGATVTPEVAVVTPGGDVAYRGRVDDRYVAFGRKRPAATTHDLRDAIAAVLAGRPVPTARTRAVGCPI